MQRSVSCRILATVTMPSEVVLSIAVAGPTAATESLTVTLDGVERAITEVEAEHQTRLHVIPDVGPGSLSVTYDATVIGVADPPPITTLDSFRYLRPSRYCQSDELAAVARFEFRGLEGRELLDGVSSWVGTRLAYVEGSSRPIDSAVSTLLARQGVCRDFAHLTIAMLRACDVPTRFVSVYAPGLDPMDFHAVVEAAVDGKWLVVDPTGLAPRSTLLRIATGRDAADTAFLSSPGNSLTLDALTVSAVTDPVLPVDDLRVPVQLS